MNACLSEPASRSRKRHWYQFRLRSLMLLTTGVAICCSVYFRRTPAEQEYLDKYGNVPVLGPLPRNNQGGLTTDSTEPPTDDDVLAALDRECPLPDSSIALFVHSRASFRVEREKVADFIDPPRVYPLIGPAQLHHAHFKCTVHFTELTRIQWPLPLTISTENNQEWVYLDVIHVHKVDHAGYNAGDRY